MEQQAAAGAAKVEVGLTTSGSEVSVARRGPLRGWAGLAVELYLPSFLQVRVRQAALAAE
eukprot:SAG11_NODE_5288_length_1605_cov_1.408367_3_plen_60_part_00